jgi:hypothetical protein
MTGGRFGTPMKAAWLVALLAGAALAGCASGEPANPNLAAPKLVVQARPDGSTTLFVHGAFADRLYDWIHVAVDNRTLANRTIAFSVEETVPSQRFYFEAVAGTSRETYELRGHVLVDPADERVEVAFLDAEGEWGDTQSFNLPFERVLVRRPTG